MGRCWVSWASGVEKEGLCCRGDKLFLPLPLRVQGKKKHNVVQNNTVLCSLFLMHETASFCLKHAVSFKRKGRQNTIFQTQSLYLCAFFSLVLGFGFLQSSP
jgi:hypothetical protein